MDIVDHRITIAHVCHSGQPIGTEKVKVRYDDKVGHQGFGILSPGEITLRP